MSTATITLDIVSLPTTDTFASGMASAWLRVSVDTKTAEIHVGYAEPGDEYTLASAIASHVRTIIRTYSTVGIIATSEVPDTLHAVIDRLVTATAAATRAA